MTSSTETFDFEKAPNPPFNHPWCRSFEWNHREWKKVLANTHVLTRQVRETFLKGRGFYPTIDAPNMLNKRDFWKFCYYANKLSDVHGEDGSNRYALDDLPEGMLPMDYEDNLEAWRESKRQAKKKSGNTEKDDKKPAGSKKQKRTHRPAAESKCVRGCRKPLSTTSVANLSLTSMGDDVRRIIADYLKPDEWQEKLRFLNKSCIAWPKPPPTFQYEVILFHFSNAYDNSRVGVAKTLQDLETAAKSVYNDVVRRQGQLYVQYWFLDFDTGAKRTRTRLPIATFRQSNYYEQWCECVEVNELALKNLGLKCVLATETGFYTSSWCSKRWNEIHGHPEHIVGCYWGYDKAWIGNDVSFGPKNPDLDLSRFQVGESYEDSEGDDVCDIYFDNNLPPSNNTKSVGKDKSWIMLDDIHLWDKD